MNDEIAPTPQALEGALALSAEILKDIELSRVTLATIALKSSRLARLLNDFEIQNIFAYEAQGYPTNPEGVPPAIWSLLDRAGRTFQQKDPESKETKTVAYLESVELLEAQIASARISLEVCRDPDVSISSANPNQFVIAPIGNTLERNTLLQQISQASQRLSSRRGFIYNYVSARHYGLKFSGIAEDVFSTVRESVDKNIGRLVPSAVQKFAAVYENLRSTNPEDWSNAVHSCRRILQDLADAVFPPQTSDRVIQVNGREKAIKIGPDNYINRLICFAEDRSDSSRFKDLVGSHLRFLGDRLDAIFKAAQKGSHGSVSRSEARRYVVYTYMLVGDILSLGHEDQFS